MNSIVINAPAKINLFLKVLERRPDGYHNIETLFEKIALFDRITLQKAPRGIAVDSDNKDLPIEKENLAYRAAGLLQDRYKRALGVRIEIEKSIPIGAGLGGGSSDAAAVLIGMNRLYDMGLSDDELENCGRRLGADVPFFLSRRVWAVGRERGDKIEGYDTRMRLWHILIMPHFSIRSKEAYEWVDKNAVGEGPGIDRTLFALRESNTALLRKSLYNDLEGIALEKEGLLKGLKDRLAEYGVEGALVSGSGPVLFGIMDDEKEVVRISNRLKAEMRRDNERWQVIVVPTLDDKEEA